MLQVLKWFVEKKTLLKTNEKKESNNRGINVSDKKFADKRWRSVNNKAVILHFPFFLHSFAKVLEIFHLIMVLVELQCMVVGLCSTIVRRAYSYSSEAMNLFP